ncbi:hypothetical protein MCUN1_001881 [Malassezia cuniculi]|uniref:Metallo-beta-lactamase domain-containing protein n=1 Tax=Malassezia cuniculi TaxID=948313 RepID=A0AAF0ERA4_9BASI|nr:hypothetical protein MCUN1_001881 [Malassezia cuniculi]
MTTARGAAGRQLDAMADITRLNERTVRILGQNPSQFTLNGTNTYLITPPTNCVWQARRSLLPGVLVDAGDLNENYIPHLETALRGGTVRTDEALKQPIRMTISDIVLTHWHHDHTSGTPLVLRMLARLRSEDPRVLVPRIHKFVEPVTDPAFIEKCLRVPRDAYIPSGHEERAVFWPLADGQKIVVADPDASYLTSTLRVVFSPGHAADHAGFLIEDDNILLTGDNILGKGTTVFEDIVLYLRSIQRYSTLLESLPPTRSKIYSVPSANDENVMYPAHGPVIARGRETARRYIKHRIERDEQLLALLFCNPKDKERVMQATAYGEEILEEMCCGHMRPATMHAWSLRELIAALYSTYPVKMYPAVARGVLLHLERLARDPATLQEAPFPVSAPLPATRWLVYGLRAKCTSRSHHLERLPSGEEEWLAALAERWTIA